MERRKSYTLLFKREALKKFNDNCGNVRKTASELNVDRKLIRDWRSKSSAIFSGEFGRENRRLVARSSPKWPDLEK